MARQYRRGQRFPHIWVGFLEEQRIIFSLCLIVIGIPLLLCGIAWWGMLFEGASAAGEIAQIYRVRLIASLSVMAFSALVCIGNAWFNDHYAFLRSILPAYLINVLGILIIQFVEPVVYAGVESSIFMSMLNLVMNGLFAVSAAVFPALIAAMIGWLVRTGYYLFRPDV